MNMSLQIVENAQFGKVRLQMIDNSPWFCAKDVCDVLGYKDSRKAIKQHCREKGVAKYPTLTDGGNQELTFINEGNVYRLITRSKLPKAQEFEEWIFEEVLPSIRKNGCYLTPAKANEIALGNEIIKAVEDLKENAVTQKTVSLLVADNIAKQQKLDRLLREYGDLQEHNQYLWNENQYLQSCLQEKTELNDYYWEKLSEIFAEKQN